MELITEISNSVCNVIKRNIFFDLKKKLSSLKDNKIK